MGDAHRRFLQTMMGCAVVTGPEAEALHKFCCQVHHSESICPPSDPHLPPIWSTSDRHLPHIAPHLPPIWSTLLHIWPTYDPHLPPICSTSAPHLPSSAPHLPHIWSTSAPISSTSAPHLLHRAHPRFLSSPSCFCFVFFHQHSMSHTNWMISLTPLTQGCSPCSCK